MTSIQRAVVTLAIVAGFTATVLLSRESWSQGGGTVPTTNPPVATAPLGSACSQGESTAAPDPTATTVMCASCVHPTTDSDDNPDEGGSGGGPTTPSDSSPPKRQEASVTKPEIVPPPTVDVSIPPQENSFGDGAEVPGALASDAPAGGGIVRAHTGGVSLSAPLGVSMGGVGGGMGGGGYCPGGFPKNPPEGLDVVPFDEEHPHSKFEPPPPEPLLFYDSQVNINRITGNWWFPYDMYVVSQANNDVHYYAPGIVGAVYAWNVASQSFASPPGHFDVMLKNPDGTWTRVDKSGTQWHFGLSGYLDWVRTRYGLQSSMTRDAQNPSKLLTFTDYAGRTSSVAYYPTGYAQSVTDWSGRTVSFTYTTQGYLQTITLPVTTYYDRVTAQIVTRAKVLTFQYISGTGTNNDGNLVGITDDAGNVAMSLNYDPLDRAISTTSRGRQWSLTYNPGGTTSVVDPDGMTILYSFTASGAIARKEVFTRSGLGQPPLRAGEPLSYVWLYERNAACGCDLITKITRPDGSTVAFSYDVWGNLTGRTISDKPGGSGSPRTDTWTWSGFPQFCRLLTHVTPEGNAPGATAADHTTTRAHDANGSLLSITFPKARVNGGLVHPVVSFTRDLLGRAVTETSASGVQTKFEYAPTTLEMTKVIEDFGGLNRTTQFGYDLLSRLTSITNPRGHTTTIQYNALSLVTQVAGPQPKSPAKGWLYDNADNVYRVELQNKDDAGNPDAANPDFTTYYTYDNNNRLTAVTVEVDATTTATTQYLYTAGGRISRITDPNGNATAFEYDERGMIFKVTEGHGSPVAGTHTWNYDLNGNPASIVNPRGYATAVQFDHADMPVRVTWADGRVDAVTYDRNSRLVAMETWTGQGPVLRRTTFTYAPNGAVLSIGKHHLDAQGTTTQQDTTSFDYDPALLLKSTTNPLGNADARLYDSLGRLSRVTSPGGDRLDFAYDANGNITQVTRSDWNQISLAFEQILFTRSFDEVDRLSSETKKDPGGTLLSTTSFHYDGRGLVSRVTDPLGNTKHLAHDARGQLRSETHDLRAGGTGAGSVQSTIVIQRGYDLGGRLVWIDDGLAHRTAYAYDARDRLSAETDAANGITAYTYDGNGNATTVVDPLGNSVASVFDALDRITSRSITRATGVLGTTSEAYLYDAVGNLVSAIDNDSTVLRAFDSLDRLASETQGPSPLGSAGKTFAFAHNAAGTMTGVTYPDGTVEIRGHDSSERLTSVSLQGGSTLLGVQYAGGRIIRETLPNGASRTDSFDALLRRTLVHYANGSTTLKKFEYVWNLADMRLLEKRHHSNGTGDNYGLDSLYRTVEVKAGVSDPVAEMITPGSQTVASTTALSLDVAQNRTQRVVTVGGTPTTTTYTADALNFYTNVGGTAHARDANGNLRDDGTHLYAYDYRNQLVEVRLKSSGALVAEYEYDPIGRRKAKILPSSGTRSFYWRGLQLAMEYDGSGVFSRRHFGPTFGEVAAAAQRDIADLDSDGNTSEHLLLTPLYDGAFDCAGVLGPTGSVVESYVHSYEGLVTIVNGAGQTISTTAIGWQQGYGRMYRDDETGWAYSLYRYYSPQLGRFLTGDPIGRWGDLTSSGNAYGYGSCRARNAWDPLGLEDKANTTVKKAFGLIHDALKSLSAEERKTIGLNGVYTVLEGDADIWVYSYPDAKYEEAAKAAGAKTDTSGFAWWKTNHLGDDWYHIVIRRSKALSYNQEQLLWLLMHELEHVAMFDRGICGDDHHKDKAGLLAFDLRVWDKIQFLRGVETKRYGKGAKKKNGLHALSEFNLDQEWRRRQGSIAKGGSVD